MAQANRSRLDDPVWTKERARKAARSRTSPTYHLDRLRAIVEATRTAQGLAPVVVDELTLGEVARLIGRPHGRGSKQTAA